MSVIESRENVSEFDLDDSLDDDFVEFVRAIEPRFSNEVAHKIYAQGRSLDFALVTEDEDISIPDERNRALKEAFIETKMKSFIEVRAGNFLDFVNSQKERHETVSDAFSEFF